jgi:hypothetical protein
MKEKNKKREGKNRGVERFISPLSAYTFIREQKENAYRH